MLEIRSYRRVFDLERRIYRIDRLKLNPAGMPIRGLVYFLGLLLVALLLDATPVLQAGVSLVPWYLRDLAAPAAGATLLGALRIDGRPAHLVACSLLRYALEPGCLSGLRPCRPSGRHWYPPELTILPDGSDGCFRGLRYHGPGSVTVEGSHELFLPRDRPRVRLGGRRPRARLLLRGLALTRARPGERRIVLRRGATLEVRPALRSPSRHIGRRARGREERRR